MEYEKSDWLITPLAADCVVEFDVMFNDCAPTVRKEAKMIIKKQLKRTLTKELIRISTRPLKAVVITVPHVLLCERLPFDVLPCSLSDYDFKFVCNQVCSRDFLIRETRIGCKTGH